MNEIWLWIVFIFLDLRVKKKSIVKISSKSGLLILIGCAQQNINKMYLIQIGCLCSDIKRGFGVLNIFSYTLKKSKSCKICKTTKNHKKLKG